MNRNGYRQHSVVFGSLYPWLPVLPAVPVRPCCFPARACSASVLLVAAPALPGSAATLHCSVKGGLSQKQKPESSDCVQSVRGLRSLFVAPYSLAPLFFKWSTQELKTSSALVKAEVFPLITVYFATVINKFDWNHQNKISILISLWIICS